MTFVAGFTLGFLAGAILSAVGVVMVMLPKFSSMQDTIDRLELERLS